MVSQGIRGVISEVGKFKYMNIIIMVYVLLRVLYFGIITHIWEKLYG